MQLQFNKMFWNLSKSEIDLVNVLINIIKRNDEFDIEHEFNYASPFYLVDTNLHELASSLGYLTLDDKVISDLTKSLDLLSKIQASIYYIAHKDRSLEKSTFVYKYVLTSIDRDLNKRLNIWLDTSIIKVLRENTEQFLKLYTYDRYDLRSKYSIVLYDALSAISKGKQSRVEYSLEEFINLLDFDLEKTENNTWAKINGNILKRVSKEIENKSNMYFRYEKVKNKNVLDESNNMVIRFEVSLAPELEETQTIYTDDELMTRKIAYYIEKDVNEKFKSVSRFGNVDINDVESYKHTVRKNLQINKDEYSAQVKVQEWVNFVKYSSPEDHGLVVLINYTPENDLVTVNNDYKLYDVMKKVELSTSAKDTQIKINAFLNSTDSEYALADTESYMKECSISYTKG